MVPGVSGRFREEMRAVKDARRWRGRRGRRTQAARATTRRTVLSVGRSRREDEGPEREKSIGEKRVNRHYKTSMLLWWYLVQKHQSAITTSASRP